MIRTIIRSLRNVAIGLGLVAGFGLGVVPASAHIDPATCTTSAVNLSLAAFRADGTTPIASGTVTASETIKYQATVSYPGSPVCYSSNGTLTVTLPNATVVNVTGAGIPLITQTSPFVSSQVSYVVATADVNASGMLNATARYTGATAHATANDSGTVSANAALALAFQKLTPTVSTQVRTASGADSTNGQVVVGTQVSDTATVAGAAGTPTGTVNFTLFLAPACNGPSVMQNNVALAAGTGSSFAFNPAAGAYSFRVHYNGDGTYTAADAACESFTVTQTMPTSGSVSEGCPAGFWKQPRNFTDWTGVTPTTLFSAVFEDAFPGQTLIQVLRQGGGGLWSLGRQTVAAYLNAANPNVHYAFTTQQVRDMFNNVFPGTRQAYKDLRRTFVEANAEFCPLPPGFEPQPNRDDNEHGELHQRDEEHGRGEHGRDGNSAAGHRRHLEEGMVRLG